MVGGTSEEGLGWPIRKAALSSVLYHAEPETTCTEDD